MVSVQNLLRSFADDSHECFLINAHLQTTSAERRLPVRSDSSSGECSGSESESDAGATRIRSAIVQVGRIDNDHAAGGTIECKFFDWMLF